METIADKEIHVDMREFSDCPLLTDKGVAIKAKSLWEKQPAIFVFLRHFACDACRKHALEVWKNRAMYEGRGAAIHFVGNGTPIFLLEFKEKYKMQSASFFTDPSLRAFRAVGFRKGFWIDPGSMHTRPEFLYKAIRFASKNENAGYGNVWQLGGVLAVKPGGIPTYQFTSLTMGHFPPASDVDSMA